MKTGQIVVALLVAWLVTCIGVLWLFGPTSPFRADELAPSAEVLLRRRVEGLETREQMCGAWTAAAAASADALRFEQDLFRRDLHDHIIRHTRP